MHVSNLAVQNRLSFALAVASALAWCSCGDCVRTPSISSTAPTSAIVGSSQVELVISGDDFQRDSIINFNGTTLTTTFVDSHQLKATVPAAQLMMPTVAKVTVSTPAPSQNVMITSASTSPATATVKGDCVGGTSNALNFAINP